MRVQRQVGDILCSVAYIGVGLDLGQTVRDKPDAVNQQAIGGALDLKVSEKCIGAKQR